MASRGPYAKGVAKRAEILELALDIIARDGYSGATVKQIADAAGLSQNGLLHYFGSKDALFTEVLRQRDSADEQRQPFGSSTAEIVDGLVEAVRHNADLAGFVQLYSRLSNEAAEPGHESHEYFRQRFKDLRHYGVLMFTRLRDEGTIAQNSDIDQLSIMLWALVDGLQTQWMYEPGIDMGESVRAFLDTLKVENRVP